LGISKVVIKLSARRPSRNKGKVLAMNFRIIVVALLLAPMVIASPAWSQQRPIVPQDLYRLKGVSDPQISPDGAIVAFTVTETDRQANRRHSDIWLAPTDGSRAPRQITGGVPSSNSPRWSPDGHSIAFLSSRPASQDDKLPKKQVFVLPLDGGEAHVATSLPAGVDTFDWSADGKKFITTSKTIPEQSSAGNSDTRHYVHSTIKADGAGYLDGRRQHLWVTEVASGKSRQITSGDWNDIDPQFSPDGTRVVFTGDRTGAYFDDMDHSARALWIVSADGGAVTKLATQDNIEEANWSPDGQWIACLSHRVPGSDAVKILLVPTNGGPARVLAQDIDIQAKGLRWNSDGSALYLGAKDHGTEQIFRIDVRSGAVTEVTHGEHYVNVFATNMKANVLVYSQSDPEHPAEIYSAQLDGTKPKQLTHFNEGFLKSVIVQPVERITYKVEDGFAADGFLLKPANWQADRKYPLIVMIHGGPNGAYGANWLLSAQVLAADGWAVFYSNPRGSVGYGTKFMQGTRGEWGGKIYNDVMTGVDTALKRNAWLDADRLGVTGCSFGGFMTNWIISHTTRFKAAVPMCAISNFVSDEGTRDFYYGHADDFGGDLFQNYDLYWKYSPLRYAAHVKTPTLILHGEADQRVPVEQAEQWYRALHHFKVPTEMVIFPHESHEGITGGGEPKHVVEAMEWQTYWFRRYLNHDESARSPDAPRQVSGTGAPDVTGAPSSEK
jgi:dipeptidyl aminopeptidase/acylaminoacyl peptidase